MNFTHTITKSNQPCINFPWLAPRDTCPFPHNYSRVCVPHNKGLHILVVRNDNLRKQVNNEALPRGKWISLTK